MARNIEVPLASASMQDRSQELSTERLVNMYPEVMSGERFDGRKTLHLHSSPGCRLFSTLPAYEESYHRINRLHNHRGTLYASAGSELYRISKEGTPTNVDGIGTPAGAIQMVSLNDDLVILQDGTLRVYRSSSGEHVTNVPNLGRVGYMSEHDGYIFVIFENNRQFAVSQLDNPLIFDPIDYFEAAFESDALIATVRRGRYQVMIGTQTTEFWVSLGFDGAIGVTVPFVRSDLESLERGCLKSSTVATTDDATFWVGDDRRVYMLTNDRRFTSVSNYVVERKIRDEDPIDATIMRFYSHTWYSLRFSDTSFLYDANYGLWHERKTDGGSWIAKDVVWCYGKNIIAPRTPFDREHDDTGIIGCIDEEEHTDLGFYINREVRTPSLYNYNRRMGMRRLEVDVEGGQGEPMDETIDLTRYLTNSDVAVNEVNKTAQPVEVDEKDVFLDGRRVFLGEDHEKIEHGEEPELLLDYSDDGGRKWSKTLPMKTGNAGDYQRRCVWNNLGLFRNRTLRFRFSHPVPLHIKNARGTFEERDLRYVGTGRYGF